MRYNDLIGLFVCTSILRVSTCVKEPETPDWRKTLKTIRNGVHKIDTYLNVALDLFGGYDGLCQYKCTDGKLSFLSCLAYCTVFIKVAG